MSTGVTGVMGFRTSPDEDVALACPRALDTGDSPQLRIVRGGARGSLDTGRGRVAGPA
jgi:hypothetical protein